MANYMLNRQNQDGLTILNKFDIVKKNAMIFTLLLCYLDMRCILG